MARKHQNIILENVVVESVAAEGKAIAHVDGAVLFLQFAVPGDIVDVKVTKKRKNYMEGYILRIVKPSGHRLEPFCSHFGVCGGCKWQPLPYSMQLEAKQQQVYDQLVRIGHLDIPEVSPIIPSERTEFYRNKLEFTFSERRWIETGENPEEISAEDRVGLGFHVGRFFDKVLELTLLNREFSIKPTVHGLRHLFAVNSMRKCLDEGESFENWIKYLSQYMGHKSVNETMYYLHLVEMLVPEYREKMAAITEGIGVSYEED